MTQKVCVCERERGKYRNSAPRFKLIFPCPFLFVCLLFPQPNCKTELWQIGCQKRVGIFTLRDVPKGTELTYDYNFEGFWQPGAALKCHCGSRNCAGTLGGKKKTVQEMKLLNAKEKGTENGKSKGKAKANGKDKSSSTKKSTKKPSALRKRPQPKSTDESKESKSDPASSFAVDSPIETDTETDEDHMEMEE